MPFPDPGKAETMAAVRDPRPGDEFHEMFSFWRIVIHRDGDLVVTMDAHPPCTLPDDGKVTEYTLAGFIKAMAYESIPDDSHMRLSKRGRDVTGWYKKPDPRPLADVERIARDVVSRVRSGLDVYAGPAADVSRAYLDLLGDVRALNDGPLNWLEFEGHDKRCPGWAALPGRCNCGRDDILARLRARIGEA
jgi:hypothetical protein